MAAFDIPGATIELPRNIALLDTNVLVAFANEEDEHHEQARLFIENEDSYSLLVAPPVVVEACGLLARRRSRRIALWLLTWLQTPGNVILLPPPHAPQDVSPVLAGHTAWMNKYDLDFVDSYLMEVAHRLTSACNLRPFAPIITFDTGDYFKCSRLGYEFSLYDMRVLDLIEFE